MPEQARADALRFQKLPPADLIGKLIDLVLMVNLPGRGRDETEYRKIFATAGLTWERIIPTQSEFKIMEAVVTR